MIFFEDTAAEQPRIEKAIKKYGYAPEHNFSWYQCQTEKKSKNVFVEFENGAGLLTVEEKEKKECEIFSSPIAPPQHMVALILKYLDHVLCSQKIKKVTLELENDLYKESLRALPKNIKARRINYTLTWPVYELEDFDPTLSGNRWKSLRKTKNKFYREHQISVLDAKEYKNKEALHAIIEQWRKTRGAHDRAYHVQYHTFIDRNFEGATEARAFVVDGKPCGINAGWVIPNSKRFYGAVGIHDYSLPGLGDVLYLEDLSWLKAKGYKEANMGGGERALTEFKAKFHPKSYYKTHIFSVVKK